MDLKSAIQTLRNQRLIVAVVLCIGLVLAFGSGLRHHPSYTANASVLMVPGSNDDGGSAPTTMARPLLPDDLPLLVKTSAVLSRVSNDLGRVSQDNLLRQIRVDVFQNSNVMTIGFQDNTQRRAVNGANAVAQEVVRYYRAIATSRFDSLSADISRQLARRQQQLRRIDTALFRATAAYPYIDDGAAAADDTSLNARMVRLQSERDELLATLTTEVSQAQAAELRLSQTAPLARAQLLSNDAVYSSTRQQYGHDVAQLRREQAQYTAHYPGRAQLQSIISREESGLSDDMGRVGSEPLAVASAYADALAEHGRAAALVAGDRSKLEQINKIIDGLQQQTSSSTAMGTQVNSLRREREAAENAYQLLSTRLTTTLADRAAAASTGSLMVFDRASSAGRSPYSMPALTAAAILIVALWAAITLAFVVEGLDHRFRTPASIEKAYGSPVLGVIG